MKLKISEGMTEKDLDDAILNNRPFDLDSFKNYKSYTSEDVVFGSDLEVGDLIKNTECADEIDLGTVFTVEAIHYADDEDGFDDMFLTDMAIEVTDEDGNYAVLHYDIDEPVGVRVNKDTIEENIIKEIKTMKIKLTENAVSDNLPGKLDNDLQGIAQSYGGFDYKDIMNLGDRWSSMSDSDKFKIKSLVRKITKACNEYGLDPYELSVEDPEYEAYLEELVSIMSRDSF